MKQIHDAISELAGEDTQSVFAARLGVSRGRVNRWMNGRERPNVENLQKLVRLGLDPAYLLGDVAIPQPAEVKRGAA